MTKGRITVHIIFGGLFALSVLASLVTLGLALFGVVGWAWLVVSVAVALVSFVVAALNFAKIAGNLDQSFNEKSGLFGKFLS